MVNFYSYVGLPESISPSEVTNCGQGGFPCLKEVSHAMLQVKGFAIDTFVQSLCSKLGLKKNQPAESAHVSGSKHGGYPNGGCPKMGESPCIDPHFSIDPH